MNRYISNLLILMTLCLSISAQQGDRRGHNMTDPIPAEKIPPAPVLSPAKAMKTIKVQDGFKLELVAAEPQVFNPVTMVFDADGRMWVCEMNTFMPNVDGKDEVIPASNIVVLTDKNGDGKVDSRKVFLENIIMPRTISLVKGGILYADNSKLYFCEVLPGLKPGTPEVVDPNYAKNGSIEHKPNTMLYGLDNWYYNSKSSDSYRALPLDAAVPMGAKEIYKNKYFKFVKRRTDNRGQWGLAMDDYGRLYHNGNSTPPMGEYLRPNSLAKNPKFRGRSGSHKIGGTAVYPIRINPGVNRGYMKNILTKEGKLKNFTAASGPVIYRGNQFPKKYYGMVLAAESAGNLISARHVIEENGRLKGKEVFPKQEIVASTDERFRPVNLYTAPDGSLYIVDMYHGIVQHRIFVTTYLRKQILARKLDTGNGDRGRIYRLRSTDNKLGKQPRLSKLSPKQLVKYLAHPNGWWRDTSRRLIVESQDKSVYKDIEQLIATSKNDYGIINALWTLEGLNTVGYKAIRYALKSENVKVRTNALEVASGLSPKAKEALAKHLKPSIETVEYEEALQLLLNGSDFFLQDDPTALVTLANRFKGKPYINEALISGLGADYANFQSYVAQVNDKKAEKYYKSLGTIVKTSNYDKLDKKAQAQYKHGKKLFYGMANCFGCHGPEGEGLQNMGPPLIHSEWVTASPERLIKIILHGIHGPITVNKKQYKPLMPMPGVAANPSFKDADIAAIATFVRNDFKNAAKPVSPELVKKVRTATKSRKIPYPVKELE